MTWGDTLLLSSRKAVLGHPTPSDSCPCILGCVLDAAVPVRDFGTSEGICGDLRGFIVVVVRA